MKQLILCYCNAREPVLQPGGKLVEIAGVV